jgi:hypothetical protein
MINAMGVSVAWADYRKLSDNQMVAASITQKIHEYRH